jgi:hypothetical protein
MNAPPDMPDPRATIIRFPAGDAAAAWAALNEARASLVSEIHDGSASMAQVCACADSWRRFLRAFTGGRSA